MQGRTHYSGGEGEGISHMNGHYLQGVYVAERTLFHMLRTLSVASALLVPLGQVLRHSEPALCLIVCVPQLTATVTTGTACGEQVLGTV